MGKRIDLTGQIFGRWKVLFLDEEKTKQKKSTYWVCECQCEKHTVKSIRASHLKDGSSKSCGCYRNEQVRKSNMKDITGMHFGFLEAIEPTERRRSTSVVWKCYCSNCNSYCFKAENDLNKGTISCGCITSKGELKIKQLLKEMNLNFVEQYTFNDLRGKDKKYLRFDFGIIENNKLLCLIEFQGSQHYYPSSLFGEEQFKRQQELDEEKRKYCNKNDIKLIEISFRDYNKINKDFLIKKIKGDNYV